MEENIAGKRKQVERLRGQMFYTVKVMTERAKEERKKHEQYVERTIEQFKWKNFYRGVNRGNR